MNKLSDSVADNQPSERDLMRKSFFHTLKESIMTIKNLPTVESMQKQMWDIKMNRWFR